MTQPKKERRSLAVWGDKNIKDEKSWLARYGKKEEPKLHRYEKKVSRIETPEARQRRFASAVPDATAVSRRRPDFRGRNNVQPDGSVPRSRLMLKGDVPDFEFDARGKKDIGRALRSAGGKKR